MIMDFKQYFKKYWQPIKDKLLINHNGKISNKFTQYLECLLQDYCRESKDVCLVREIRYLDSGIEGRKKLDYLICKNEDLRKYIRDDKKLLRRGEVCIEAQWDNKKFDSDFVKGDFPKLVKFTAKLKVAIVNINIKSKNPEYELRKALNFLRKKVIKDKSKYFIYLCGYDKDKKEFYSLTSDNFTRKKIQRLVDISCDNHPNALYRCTKCKSSFSFESGWHITLVHKKTGHRRHETTEICICFNCFERFEEYDWRRLKKGYKIKCPCCNSLNIMHSFNVEGKLCPICKKGKIKSLFR